MEYEWIGSRISILAWCAHSIHPRCPNTVSFCTELCTSPPPGPSSARSTPRRPAAVASARDVTNPAKKRRKPLSQPRRSPLNPETSRPSNRLCEERSFDQDSWIARGWVSGGPEEGSVSRSELLALAHLLTIRIADPRRDTIQQSHQKVCE